MEESPVGNDRRTLGGHHDEAVTPGGALSQGLFGVTRLSYSIHRMPDIVNHDLCDRPLMKLFPITAPDLSDLRSAGAGRPLGRRSGAGRHRRGCHLPCAHLRQVGRCPQGKASGARINYQSVGSGAGIKQIKTKTVDFGASDMPLKDEDLAKDGLLQFPTVIGGVVPVVNIKGIQPGQIRLTGPVLADIYLGKITKWNDAAISALNPGVPLPKPSLRRWRVPMDRAPPSSSPTICPRLAAGSRRSVGAPPSSGQWARQARAMRASPPSCSVCPTRSATSSTPTSSRTR